MSNGDGECGCQSKKIDLFNSALSPEQTFCVLEFVRALVTLLHERYQGGQSELTITYNSNSIENLGCCLNIVGLTEDEKQIFANSESCSLNPFCTRCPD